MSAISSIGGSGLIQLLKSVAKQKTHQAAAKASAPTGFGPAASTAATGSSLISQIQQTVTSALQQAKATGSTKDPNQIVEDSIASLLKNIFSGKSPPPTAGSSTPSAQLSFQNALKSVGVTSQQFQSDFKAAVDDAQDSLGGSLPTGTTLDVTG
jgi:hypothetical protein